LPTVYALRGNNLRKKIKGKKNSCPNSTEKCRKIPTHDKKGRKERKEKEIIVQIIQEKCQKNSNS
jgi:hypothetical protein